MIIKMFHFHEIKISLYLFELSQKTNCFNITQELILQPIRSTHRTTLIS